MDLSKKLIENEKLNDLLKSESLRKQLTDVLDKKREKDIYDLLNKYYGSKLSKNSSDDNVLNQMILSSNEFKELIIELLNIIEDNN